MGEGRVFFFERAAHPPLPPPPPPPPSLSLPRPPRTLNARASLRDFWRPLREAARSTARRDRRAEEPCAVRADAVRGSGDGNCSANAWARAWVEARRRSAASASSLAEDAYPSAMAAVGVCGVRGSRERAGRPLCSRSESGARARPSRGGPKTKKKQKSGHDNLAALMALLTRRTPPPLPHSTTSVWPPSQVSPTPRPATPPPPLTAAGSTHTMRL